MDIKYIIFLYIILILIIYLWKPKLFVMNNIDDKRRKTLYLIFLIIIIAIIAFYMKVLFEWFT